MEVWSSSSSKMIAQAKKDLQTLETQHPNRFEYLKLELKSFIFLLESQKYLFPPENCDIISSSSQLVSTQASTCEKRKKDSSCGVEEEGIRREAKRKRFSRVEDANELKMKKDRVELVLERAHSCLRKIQALKASLC